MTRTFDDVFRVSGTVELGQRLPERFEGVCDLVAALVGESERHLQAEVPHCRREARPHSEIDQSQPHVDIRWHRGRCCDRLDLLLRDRGPAPFKVVLPDTRRDLRKVRWARWIDVFREKEEYIPRVRIGVEVALDRDLLR